MSEHEFEIYGEGPGEQAEGGAEQGMGDLDIGVGFDLLADAVDYSQVRSYPSIDFIKRHQ
jgi:hypothetical protein